MPADTYSAIYAYNHADWYVAEVLANAACYAGIGSAAGGFSLTPQLQELSCRPAEEWRDAVPDEYMTAFESAAARYELGRKGVWALAAVARLESNFGRGMGKRQMQKYGPLGLDGSEWRTYAVDGDQDGKVRRSDPDDSAATLARLIWSRGSLRAGIFTHNQAHWYVEAVLDAGRTGRGRLHAAHRRLGRRPAGSGRRPDQLGKPDALQRPRAARPDDRRDRPADRRPDRRDHPGAPADDLGAALRPLRIHRERIRLQPLLRPGDGHRRGRRGLLHRHRDRRALREPRPHPGLPAAKRCTPPSSSTASTSTGRAKPSRSPITAITSTSASTARGAFPSGNPPLQGSQVPEGGTSLA